MIRRAILGCIVIGVVCGAAAQAENLMPNGSFEVRDWNYKIAPDPQVRGDVLESVIKENSRFYHQ